MCVFIPEPYSFKKNVLVVDKTMFVCFLLKTF